MIRIRKKQKLIILSATMVAVSGTIVPSIPPVTADDQVAKTDQSSDKTTGLKVTPVATDLNQAIQAAKDAGLTVDTTTKVQNTVTTADTTATKKNIEADYANQAKQIRQQIATYQQQVAQYNSEKAAYDKVASQIPTDKDDTNTKGLNLNGGVSKNNDWRYMMTGSRDDVHNANLTIVANKNMDGKVAEHHYLKRGTIIKWNDNTQMTQEKGKTKSMYDGTLYDKGGSVVLTNVGTLQDGTNVNLRLTGDQSFLVAPHEPNQDNNQRTGKIIVDSLDDLNLKTELLDDKGNSLNVWQGNYYGDIDEPVNGYAQNLDLSKSQSNGIAIVDNNLNANGYTLSPKTVGDNHDSNKYSVMTVTQGTANTIHLYTTGSLKSVGYGGNDLHLITPLFGQQLNVNVANPPIEVTKPKISAAFTDLYETPSINKDVDAGDNIDDISGSSNSKVFMKGDQLTYSLKTDPLPGGREQAKSLAIIDKIPDGFDPKTIRVHDGDQDITDKFEITTTDGQVKITPKEDLLAKINQQADEETVFAPLITIAGVATKEDVTMDNDYQLLFDDQTFASNKVSNPVKTIAVHKDVKAGVKDTLTKTSVAGKAVVKGQALTYDLSMDDLPANRATDIQSLSWTDKLPRYVNYAGYKVFNAQGEDVTANYEYQGNNKRQFSLKAKPEALAIINADKDTAYKSDRIEIYTNANEDGVNFKNNAKLTMNNQDYDSNTVTNHTPNYHPIKKDVDADQNDYNNKNVKPGDTIHYQVIGDLSEMTNLALTSDQINDETFQLSDDYDETRLDVTDDVKKDFKIAILKDAQADADKTTDKEDTSEKPSTSTDSSVSSTEASQSGQNGKSAAQASSVTTDKSTTSSEQGKSQAVQKDDTILIDKGTAKEFDMADVDVKWDDHNGRFTVTPKDQVAFLKKYAGDKLVAYFNPIVKDDATGVIENVAAQTSFGEEKTTNQVKNPISEHSTIERTIDKQTKEKELPNTGSHHLVQTIVSHLIQLFNR